jgi:hypothetical protein
MGCTDKVLAKLVVTQTSIMGNFIPLAPSLTIETISTNQPVVRLK